MRVSIFGVGYVGAVTAGCLAELGHHVVAVDVAVGKLEMLQSGRSPIVEAQMEKIIARAAAAATLVTTTSVAEAVEGSEISLISVGTPSGKDGALSLLAIEQVASEIGRALLTKKTPHHVVMRSTVPPGTAARKVIPILERESRKQNGGGFSYYSNPEFLREGSAVGDFRSPPFTLVGAATGDTASVLRELYAEIDAPLHVTSYDIAESVKYLSNIYHAVKLAFANEAGAVLAAHGVDANAAFNLFCEDRVLNISRAYLRPGFAFGGSCLPKDVRSFLDLANQAQVPVPLLKQLLPSNDAIIERVFQTIMQEGRQPVSLFGLAFKPGTDDLRESPFVVLAERLVGRGFPVRIFDRFVELSRLTGSNRVYIDREIPHLEMLMAASAREALAGSRIVIIGHVSGQDRDELVEHLVDQAVFDLAGICELKDRPGISYRGLHW